MTLKLTKRMQVILDMCEPCDTIVDVGTDHGKVAIAVANMNISKNVIAIDNKSGPINVCINNSKKYLNQVSSNFIPRLSEGIVSLDKTTEYGIIIAGIGFDNISNMLSNINEYNYKYLILSPHTKVTELIKYLSEFKIKVVDMKNVYEYSKYYYILKAKKE